MRTMISGIVNKISLAAIVFCSVLLLLSTISPTQSVLNLTAWTDS